MILLSLYYYCTEILRSDGSLREPRGNCSYIPFCKASLDLADPEQLMQ